MFWDLTISMLLLITCVTTPFDLAFADEIEDVESYTIFRNTIDILFFIDIVVIFNTAYQTDAMEIEDDRFQIAKAYIQGWFIIDLMAVLPFEFILKLFMHGGGEGNGNVDYNKFVRMSRMTKIYKLIKITRLIRLLKLMKKTNKGAVNKLGKTLKIS